MTDNTCPCGGTLNPAAHFTTCEHYEPMLKAALEKQDECEHPQQFARWRFSGYECALCQAPLRWDVANTAWRAKPRVPALTFTSDPDGVIDFTVKPAPPTARPGWTALPPVTWRRAGGPVIYDEPNEGRMPASARRPGPDAPPQPPCARRCLTCDRRDGVLVHYYWCVVEDELANPTTCSHRDRYAVKPPGMSEVLRGCVACGTVLDPPTTPPHPHPHVTSDRPGELHCTACRAPVDWSKPSTGCTATTERCKGCGAEEGHVRFLGGAEGIRCADCHLRAREPKPSPEPVTFTGHALEPVDLGAWAREHTLRRRGGS